MLATGARNPKQTEAWKMSLTARPRRPLRERFLEKVQKTENCWIWTGGKTSNGGYGMIRNEDGRGGRHLRAHRVAYELFVAPIPEGMCVLHRCDNPGCVNPDHLFLGTDADNAADSVAKGRQAQGERNGSAKLTQRQVQEIREQYRRGSAEFGCYGLGRQYGVDHSAIFAIVKGRNWKPKQIQFPPGAVAQ